jgi:hypothetical protein
MGVGRRQYAQHGRATRTVSIHAPAGGDEWLGGWTPGFDPRPRAGGDPMAAAIIQADNGFDPRPVRGATRAQRGGAGAAEHADPWGQAPSPAADQSPHPVEGGQFGRWRRMERQPDRNSPRYQRRHGRADPPTAGSRWEKASRPSWSASIRQPRPKRAFSTEPRRLN